MGLVHETLPCAAIYENPQSMVATAMGLIALGASASKAFKVIPQGDVGIRMRSGRPVLKDELHGLHEEEIAGLPPEISNKGIYQIESKRIVWLRPFVDDVVKVNVTDRTSDPRAFYIESSEDCKFQIDAAFGWYVRRDGDNPFKARFNVNNEKRDSSDKDKDRELEQTVVSICNSGLRRVLSGRSIDSLLNINDEEVQTNTRVQCKDKLLNYGVALKDVRIESVARVDASIIAKAIIESRNIQQNELIASLAIAERDETRIPLHAVPSSHSDPLA
jgi:regulator of protease activity HflC (stomatin/prohibitin superfamily)